MVKVLFMVEVMVTTLTIMMIKVMKIVTMTVMMMMMMMITEALRIFIPVLGIWSLY